jgi:hypothetical protein
MNKGPHYHTRVIHNRQFLKIDGWRHFVLYWFVELLTLNMDCVRQSQGAAICFTIAGLILVYRIVGMLWGLL